MQTTGPAAAIADPASAKLDPNAIGLVGAVTLGVVFLSPAMTLYGLFGPIFLAAGRAAPLAFVFALLATLPTAYGYAVLSRDYPSSGSAADWSARATTPRIGIWTGWIVFLYYLTNFVIQPVALGLFFGDLLKTLNLSPATAGAMGFGLGVLFCCALPAWLVYRGITLSTKSALVFLLIEISVVIALCGTIVALAPGHGTPLSLSGFSLSAAGRNPSGLFGALVFGMLAFCGFDVVSTVAEETKMARKLIPRATIIAVLLYAVLIIGGIWALTLGGNADALHQAAKAGRMPINDVARTFWGRGALMVTFTAITATLGLAVVTSVGASRILFDMGRRGASRLFAASSAPQNALERAPRNFCRRSRRVFPCVRVRRFL